MPDILGIDTSNYTTSAAVLTEGNVLQSKKLLPVRPGEVGIRQSDAVFHHVQQLPQVLEALPLARMQLAAVGVSDRPRCMEGSYMPCFLAGYGTAKAIALSLGVPLHCFSHQQGHVAASLFSARRLSLLRTRFLAFHVSGGTTEALLVTPDAKNLFQTETVASSLDLKAGQAIDRTGVMLGLPFPAGPELERLALLSQAWFTIRPSMKGADCSLSGVENQCRKMLERGEPREDIALFCLLSVQAALDGMIQALQQKYGELPMVFAGGVMSNHIIRAALTEKYGAVFAEPIFSADNAAGIAVLASLKEGIVL